MKVFVHSYIRYSVNQVQDTGNPSGNPKVTMQDTFNPYRLQSCLILKQYL